MSDTWTNVITRLGLLGLAKGATAAAQATVTTVDADHNALDVTVKGTPALAADAATATLQGTGNTSAATTATNTGTIAGAVSAPDATLPTSAAQIGGVASTAAPSPVTSGRGVRAWFSLIGAQMVGLLGANGSAIASASNGVPVAPETSSTWDISSRAARLIGGLTGVNGSGVATLANPVPAQLSDGSAGYTGAKTGQLPTGLGILTSAASLSITSASDALFDVKDRAARLLGALTGINGSGVATGANPVPVQLSSGSAVYTGATAALSLPVVFAPSLNTTGATLPVNGVVIKSGVGVALWVTITNTTGGSIYWQVFDRASGPPNAGERAAASAPAITANNGSRAGDLIGPTMGLGFTNGCLLVASSSPTTYAAIASTGVSYTFVYL